MKARDIFFKTMPFVWAKLLLWLATIIISAVWFAILALIAVATKNSTVGGIAVFLWLGGTGVVRFIIMHYFGYLVKAGHIAVIAEAVVTGSIPENQVEYGKKVVTERFATANVFFVIDKLVSGAVKQIQRVVGRVGGMLGFIPGMKQVTSIAQFFVELSLGYVDECCLGYVFYKKDQGAFKSAADGVVIYWQNWKKLLANAAKTMVKVLLALAVVVIVFTTLFTAILSAAPSNFLISIAAFVFALFAAAAIKASFLDSYILVQTMAVYMQVAPETVISYNLYEKLCGLSKKFKDLFGKANQEQPISPQPAYAGAGAGAGGAFGDSFGGEPAQTAAPFFDRAAPSAQSGTGATGAGGGAAQVFCTMCGARNTAGSKFCGSCGKQL